MFTGIIEEKGAVESINSAHDYTKLKIRCEKVLEGTKLGDSIAVNGICLTVCELGADFFTADVMPETMRHTTLRFLKKSDSVNLERALRLGSRLGGHMVSGHIDQTGVIGDIKREGNAMWLTVMVKEGVLRYIVKKGSIAIDGASLTVAYVDGRCFKVSLIPTTAAETTLGSLRRGDAVNIECDMTAKYIEKFLKNSEDANNKDISLEFLQEHGF